MATALAKIEPQLPGALAYEPQNLEQAMSLSKALFGSGLLPRSIKTPQDLLIIMMTGRELGLSTQQAIRTIYVVDGKPSPSADLLVGLVKRHRDVCEYFSVVEQTADRAVVETQRVGAPAPERFEYTMADARGAGLTGKDNWKKYPAAMLMARCQSMAARKVYPDLVMGLYIPDELESSPPDAGVVLPAGETVDSVTGEVLVNEPPKEQPTSAVERTKKRMMATGKGKAKDKPAPMRVVDQQADETEAEAIERAKAEVTPKEEPKDEVEIMVFSSDKGKLIASLDSATLLAHLETGTKKLDANPGAEWAPKVKACLVSISAELSFRKTVEEKESAPF